jgi:hypothetical protein
MHTNVFRPPIARWAITITALTALAGGAAVPAYATPQPAQPGAAHEVMPLPRFGYKLAHPIMVHRSARMRHQFVEVVGMPTDPGTSPAVGASPYGVEYASQYSNQLYLIGAFNDSGYTGFGMAKDTSPSVAALANGGYEVAFQANTGVLYLDGTATNGLASTGLGMAPGTSPAITSLSGGGYEVALQALGSGVLCLSGNAAAFCSSLGIAPGTSPAITGLPGGGYETAFQANGSGTLYLSGTAGNVPTNYGMQQGTSPAITQVPGGYQAAFQAASYNNQLWVYGTDGNYDTNYGMDGDTNPSITTGTSAGYEAAFQANTNSLWVTGYNGAGPMGYPMTAGVSPAIAEASGNFFFAI